MYRHEKGGKMEKNIIHYLLFSCDNIEEQMEAVKKLRMVPEKFYDQETRVVLKGIEFSHGNNKLATERSIATYFKFNKEKFDVDDYFWDTDEKEANHIVLQDACELFVKQREIEINKELVSTALSNYEKTGDITLLSKLDLASAERKKAVKSIKEATSLGLKKLESIKNKTDLKSIKFSKSFFYMEMILKGLEPGELIIMAARPGVGKTAFSLGFLNDFSKQGKRSMYVTLEMAAEELTERMLIAKTGIPRSVFFSQTGFTDEKFTELENAAKELNKQPIIVVDDAPGTFVEIREIIREEHRKNGLDIVFIDYLGLIGSYSGEDNFNVRDTVSKISRGCKLLAMELKIPIILIQQVNRNAAAGTRDDSSFKELQLTDLRDSGSLEQDANKVFLLWNAEPQTEKDKQDQLDSKYKVILNIAKNRNGQSNQKVLFEFNRTIQRIKEVDWITKPSTWGKKND
jgi:replicative DNA helicase